MLLNMRQMLYKQLLFLRSSSDTPLCQKYLSRTKMLEGLLIIQREGSPRCVSLALRLLRSFLSHLNQDLVNDALQRAYANCPSGGDNEVTDFVNSMLGSIGEVLVTDTSFYGMPSTPGAMHHGYGSGHIALAMTAERVSLLRVLLSEYKWRDYVVQEILTAIMESYHTLKDAGIFSGPVSMTFNDKSLYLPISRLLAALTVIGGHIDLLRVGGRVEMIGEGGNVFGTTLRYSRGSSEALVAFGNTAAALPHEVNVESLAAVDELASLSNAIDFSQTPEVLLAFLDFIRIEIEAVRIYLYFAGYPI